MPKINIEKLSLKELEALKSDVERVIDQRREQDRAALKQQMEEMASEAGYTLDELFGKLKGKKAALTPKYRNPDNPSQTWSGRGRKPRWLVDLLAAGKFLEDYLIDK